MAQAQDTTNWLDRPVNSTTDHVLGVPGAEITLVEYGSYACSHCRAANERIAEVRDRFGARLRYVFRHRPVTGSEIARRAAELVERAPPERFWDAHIALMTRSAELTEDDLVAVARDLDLPLPGSHEAQAQARRAHARVEEDMESARNSGVRFTPSFFINGRRYDGPWDETSFLDAMLGRLGHRVSAAALDFASWAPSAGLLLLFTTLLAVGLTNSMWGAGFTALWEAYLGFNFAEYTFRMSLLHWINDGLLTIFFLVVGLEIKREFTIGHLASPRQAALPIAAAVGGLALPTLIYMAIVPTGPWAHGWGVPMATDTAFAVALIVMMGARVPIELRIFLTAAAIVDDIGAIMVVAFFYSGALNIAALAAAGACVAVLAMLNRWRVYALAPYALVGILLWAFVHAGGLHATLAGVILALFVPTRPPPNLRALMLQANAIIEEESEHSGEVLRHGPSLPAMQALDAIHDRLESPADRLLRHAGARSSYVVLPLFALANAGVILTMDVIGGHEPLMLAIMLGLMLGKPLGLVGASWAAVKLGWAVKPDGYSWRQMWGAGALAGIGFTMSLFIAGQAFPVDTDFAAAKIAVFAASVLSAVAGVALLWGSEKKRLAAQEAAAAEQGCA